MVLVLLTVINLYELLHVYTSSLTCVFCFQTELDSGGDCSGVNSANCKTGLVCDATGSTCSEFLCFVCFLECDVVLIKWLFLVVVFLRDVCREFLPI